MLYDGFRIHRPSDVEVENVIIGNTITITLGDAVKTTGGSTGYAEPADAVADEVYGIAVDFVDVDGFSYKTKTTNFDGTFTEAAAGDTYVSASDNLTDKKIAVRIAIIGVNTVLSAKLSAAKGTTSGSDKVGTYYGVLTTNSTQIGETTATGTKSGNTAYMSVSGLASDNITDPNIPDSTTRILVKCIRLQSARS